MFENEHIHNLEDRQGRWLCVDVSRLNGQVFGVGYYTSPTSQAEVISLVHKCNPSLV